MFRPEFILHHAVTAKVCVALTASAETRAEVSLNETQIVGPTIQDDIRNFILRFRQRRVALPADREKMYWKIRVDPADWMEEQPRAGHWKFMH